MKILTFSVKYLRILQIPLNPPNSYEIINAITFIHWKRGINMKINTLRSFITLAVSATVAAALFCAATLFYTKSADTLKDNYSKDITRQLNQINNQVEDQIDIIDSVYPLFMSNNLIREYLDPASSVYTSKSPVEKRLEIERQMSYLLISTYLWDEKFVNSVYIFDMNGGYSKVSLYENNSELDQVKTIYDQVSKEGASLQIKTLNSDNHSIYFSRNVNSMYTGSQIGTIILDISQDAWKQSYSRNTDENWLICIFNKDMQVLSHAQSSNTAVFQGLMEQTSTGGSPFREIKLDKTSYFMASQQLGTSGITSAVAVPKPYLLKDLNQTLRSFLFIFLIIILITLVFTILLSHLITAPIERMIQHIKCIADGKREQAGSAPVSLYSEFNDLAGAFEAMLEQLDIYYNDIYQKQLLLKNSEIKALQSQMDPHFLFNVLDTIAWKAQMSGNEDIYQMIISLGELLRSNILSHEKDFVSLEEELTYVRFYIYLQQTRFEDKFTAEIHADLDAKHITVPRFCIQPLVENSIVHGLEPKATFGRLAVNIIEQDDFIEINVADNGVGFADSKSSTEHGSADSPLNIDTLKPSKEDSRTHIGLRNLNKRLILLYGENCRLQIMSIPDKCTTITFKIPKERGNEL